MKPKSNFVKSAIRANWSIEPETGALTLRVTGMPLRLGTNVTERMHWATLRRERAALRDVVRGATGAPPLAPTPRFDGPVEITCTRAHGGHTGRGRAQGRSRPMDEDNLPACFKAPIDALKGWLITDDSPKLVRMRFAQAPRDQLGCDWSIEIQPGD